MTRGQRYQIKFKAQNEVQSSTHSEEMLKLCESIWDEKYRICQVLFISPVLTKKNEMRREYKKIEFFVFISVSKMIENNVQIGDFQRKWSLNVINGGLFYKTYFGKSVVYVIEKELSLK